MAAMSGEIENEISGFRLTQNLGEQPSVAPDKMGRSATFRRAITAIHRLWGVAKKQNRDVG